MSELYNRIEQLCSANGITITQLCRGSGASRGSLTDLKMGRKQSLSADTLTKIAGYLEVSVDYLLGKEEQKEKSPSARGERGLDFDAFTYAMYEEGKELTEENKAKLLEMAKFFRQQQEKEKP